MREVVGEKELSLFLPKLGENRGSRVLVRKSDTLLRPRNRRWLLLVLVVAAAQITIATKHYSNQQFMDRLMDRVAPTSLPPSEQALRILDYMRDLPIDSNQHYFLLPIFRFLRATPRQIATNGGDCADRSRLMIALLHRHGIYASKWALYSPQLRPTHAVIEVKTEQGRMAVDPLYGLWFPRPNGGYYGIGELKSNPQILRERLQYLRLNHIRPGAGDLDGYPTNVYIYGLARTINWDKSVVPYAAYKALHWLIGERANYLPRPQWVETPEYVVLAGLGILQLCILALWLLGSLGRWRASARASRAISSLKQAQIA